jgi:hypothetical protein
MVHSTMFGVLMMTVPCIVFVMVPLLRGDNGMAVFAGVWSVAAVFLIMLGTPTIDDGIVRQALARALRALRLRFAGRLTASEREAIDTALKFSRVLDGEMADPG